MRDVVEFNEGTSNSRKPFPGPDIGQSQLMAGGVGDTAQLRGEERIGEG